MSIDRRFALLTQEGDVLYPYIKTERATGRTGFALSAPGKRDAKGQAEYTTDIAEVIRRVVFDGWSVRMRVTQDMGDREGSFGLKKRVVDNFWIDPTLESLVTGYDASYQKGKVPQPTRAKMERQALWPFPIGYTPSADETEEESTDINPLYLAAAIAEINADLQVKNEPPTTRQALVEARIGQGEYRKRMLELWNRRCSVTGCSTQLALIASHAKPWAGASNVERLDAYNGLLLAASIDRLFDRGLISFDDDGRMLRKPELTDADLTCLGLQPDARLRAVYPRNLPYLAAHRNSFGF